MPFELYEAASSRLRVALDNNPGGGRVFLV
jgi:hypothetical protein